MASHSYATAVDLTSVLRFIYDDLEFLFDSKTYRLERFSLKYRKYIAFDLALYAIGLKKLLPLLSVNQKTKTNRDSLTHVFPRFATATCIIGY